jgi:hypothetical protein
VVLTIGSALACRGGVPKWREYSRLNWVALLVTHRVSCMSDGGWDNNACSLIAPTTDPTQQ